MNLRERLNKILLSEMIHIDIGENPYPDKPRWKKFRGLVDFELERLFTDQAARIGADMVKNGRIKPEDKKAFEDSYKHENLSRFYVNMWKGKSTAEYMGDYIRFLPNKVIATTPQPGDVLLPHE